MSSARPHPADTARRSQLYRWHERNGAQFRMAGDRIVVAAYADAHAEEGHATRCALIDLSTHPRVGLRSTECAAWLRATGADVPERPNRSAKQGDGGTLLRLSPGEFLLLGDLALEGDGPRQLADRLARDPAAPYTLPRADSHCWFVLSGIHGAGVMARLCGVDFRAHRFERNEIAQTSVARVNAIVAAAPTGDTQRFHLLCDVSAAEYLWQALLDAMKEFDGEAIGIDALTCT